MTAPIIDAATIELRPGTRWVRLLLILQSGTAHTVGDLLRLSRLQGVAFKVERVRISQALRRMCDHGLTVYVHGAGWTATADGKQAALRYQAATARPAPIPARQPRPVPDLGWLDLADRDRRETNGRPAKRQKLRLQDRAA